MKKIIFSLLVVFSLLISIESKAACPSPTDCLSDAWTTVTVTTNINGCTVTYKYCYRLACGTWKDLYLDEITFGFGCTPIGGAYDINDLIEDIQKQILYSNPWGGIGLPPCPTMSPTHYRFFAGTCFYYCRITDYVTVKWCNPDAICYQTYKACNGAGGPTGWTGVTIEVTSSGTWGACYERVADCDCDGTPDQKVKDCITRCP
jgi:hypothetical protein